MEVSASSSRVEEISSSEQSKIEFSSAWKLCEKMLISDDIIYGKILYVNTSATKAMANELYSRVLDMIGEMKFIEDEELILSSEFVPEGEFLDSTPEGSSTSDSDYIESPEKKSAKAYIPLEQKMKAITLAKQHPNWNVESFRKNGVTALKRKSQLKQWEEDINIGGTKFEKFNAINTWTYKRFVEARENLEQVTTRTIQQWGMTAASQYVSKNFKFAATSSWADHFKKKYGIRQRKITKYVSEREIGTMEETIASAEKFRKQIMQLTPNFHDDYIINTDQTGCQYQSTIERTLAQKGVKSVFVKKQNLSKITHTYTAQYALTLSGKLLPHVFLCMQETTGNQFGPIVRKKVDQLEELYSNIIVTCSKSGKLTTAHYKTFLQRVMLPFVKQQRFLLLVDSWGGQTNYHIYDEIFNDSRDNPTCTLKIIPPKCTPLCQPCDVYSYRQIKILIKRLQNSTYLLENKREIFSREDAIKMHSLIHNQLSAYIFRDMIKYAWFASKLVEKRNNFKNVNEVCFPETILRNKCICGKTSFIKCSWCEWYLCFVCFYDEYHPSKCLVFS